MEIILPTECPSCGSEELDLVGDLLFCTSKDCDAQFSGKLQKFCKVLKIKGFGPSTLERLGLKSVNDLVELTPEFVKTKGFSDAMSVKLTQAVKDRMSSGITFSDFLAAMSIPHVGAGTSRKLSHLSVDELTFNKCKTAGLGDVAANAIMTWAETDWPGLSTLDIPIIKVEAKPEGTKKAVPVCITGKLNDFASRKKATEYLESHGYEVKTTLTKAVKYLICEDGKTTSSSYKKSIAAGIPVVTIKKLLGEN